MRFREQPAALVFSFVALLLAALTGVLIPLSSGTLRSQTDLSWTPPPTVAATVRSTATSAPIVAARATIVTPTPRPLLRAAATATRALAPTATATGPTLTATTAPASATPTRIAGAVATAAATVDMAARVPEGPVNLRSGPGMRFTVLGLAKSGDRFTVRGRSEDSRWMQLCCLAGEPVWAAIEFVQLPSSIERYPIVR